MARLLYISFLLAFAFMLIPGADAALIFTENFNNLTDGALPGQNNWVNELAGDDITVTSLYSPYEGLKQIYSSTSSGARYVYRNVPHLLSYTNGSMSIRVRKDDNNNAAGALQVVGMNGTTLIYMVTWYNDNGIKAYFGAGVSGNISAGINDEWAEIRLQWQNDSEYTVCVNATTYGCLSGDNYNTNIGKMSRIRLTTNNEKPSLTEQYFDNIKIYDTFEPPAGPTDYITLLSPTNTTYTNNTLNINLTNSTPIDSFWYRVNNISTNISFVPGDHINLGNYGIGTHNITVFGNTSLGEVLEASVYFSFQYVTIESQYIPSIVFETDKKLSWLDLEIHNYTAVSSVAAGLSFNGTKGNVTTGFASNYTSILNIPNIISENTITAYWHYNVSYTDGSTSMHNGTMTSVLVKVISLTSCASGNVTLEFRGFNESNSTLKPLAFTMGIAAEIGLSSKHFNFTLSGSNTYKLCITPGDEEYTGDIDIEYFAADYPKRYYYMRNAVLTNDTTVVNLYLLHEDEALAATDFIIRDKNYKEQPNMVIQAQRYFPGLGSYLTVAMGLTGPNGKTSMFLVEDVYYKWLIQRDGTTLVLTSPEPLLESPIIQYIDVDPRAAFFQYIEDLAYRCRDDTASQNIICEYSAPATNLESMTLVMKKRLLYNRTTPFCTETSTEPSDTLICNYAAYENDTVYWELEGMFSGSGTEWLVLANGFIEPQFFLWGGALGASGILVAIGMFLLFVGAGMTSPRIAVIMATISIPISWLAGLHAISFTTIMGLCAAAGILVYRMKD